MPWSKGPVLVLAPDGRDGRLASTILSDMGVRTVACADLDAFVDALDHAACGVLAEEALAGQDAGRLGTWVERQPPWSDFPFLLLGHRGHPPPSELVDMLGNVTVLERPFHASTLVNAVRSGLRARHRQREAEQHLVERHRTAERQSLLIRELHHRVRNMLANVQAMLGATARSTTSIDAFTKAFSGRIASLARTQTLLTEDYWQSVPLRSLLRGELAPYDGTGRRVHLDGPDIELTADIAIPVGMAVHELTTNAVRYGALSVDEGDLQIAWQVREAGAERVLDLRWSERGGPDVAPPARQGFGSAMLERVLAVQCAAEIRQDFAPSGFVLTMSIALPSRRLVPGYEPT